MSNVIQFPTPQTPERDPLDERLEQAIDHLDIVLAAPPLRVQRQGPNPFLVAVWCGLMVAAGFGLGGLF